MTEFDLSFERAGRRIPIDASTDSLHTLALTMALAGHGWITRLNRAGDGTVEFGLESNNSRAMPYHPGDEDIFIEELGLRAEDGTTKEGYSVTTSNDSVHISFSGVPDEFFSQTMQRLFTFSENLGG